MTTKEATIEVSLEEQVKRLWALGNTTELDFRAFIRFTERADVLSSNAISAKKYKDFAEVALAKIEDAIKRYREGRPQSYEEKATD